MIFNKNTKREKIEKSLLNERPNYSKASLKTYSSLIFNLIPKEGIIDLEDTEKTIKYVKDKAKSQNSNKTILSAFYVLSGLQEYKNEMMNEIDKYNANIRRQEKTKTDKENWIDFSDIEKIYDEKSPIIWKLTKQEKLKPKERRDIRKFMMFLLTSGLFFPPRRNMDWTMMYMKKEGHETDNYIEGKYFHFNRYKTHYKYNEHILEIPKEIRKWLRAYKKIFKTDLLFTDDGGNQLNSNTFNQKLQSFFGKNISTSLLRKIYLTNEYKDVPTLKKIDETAEKMGHTFSTALTNYVKH